MWGESDYITLSSGQHDRMSVTSSSSRSFGFLNTATDNTSLKASKISAFYVVNDLLMVDRFFQLSICHHEVVKPNIRWLEKLEQDFSRFDCHNSPSLAPPINERFCLTMLC